MTSNERNAMWARINTPWKNDNKKEIERLEDRDYSTEGQKLGLDSNRQILERNAEALKHEKQQYDYKNVANQKAKVDLVNQIFSNTLLDKSLAHQTTYLSKADAEEAYTIAKTKATALGLSTTFTALYKDDTKAQEYGLATIEKLRMNNKLYALHANKYDTENSNYTFASEFGDDKILGAVDTKLRKVNYKTFNVLDKVADKFEGEVTLDSLNEQVKSGNVSKKEALSLIYTFMDPKQKTQFDKDVKEIKGTTADIKITTTIPNTVDILQEFLVSKTGFFENKDVYRFDYITCSSKYSKSICQEVGNSVEGIKNNLEGELVFNFKDHVLGGPRTKLLNVENLPDSDKYKALVTDMSKRDPTILKTIPVKRQVGKTLNSQDFYNNLYDKVSGTDGVDSVFNGINKGLSGFSKKQETVKNARSKRSFLLSHSKNESEIFDFFVTEIDNKFKVAGDTITIGSTSFKKNSLLVKRYRNGLYAAAKSRAKLVSDSRTEAHKKALLEVASRGVAVKEAANLLKAEQVKIEKLRIVASSKVCTGKDTSSCEAAKAKVEKQIEDFENKLAAKTQSVIIKRESYKDVSRQTEKTLKNKGVDTSKLSGNVGLDFDPSRHIDHFIDKFKGWSFKYYSNPVKLQLTNSINAILDDPTAMKTSTGKYLKKLLGSKLNNDGKFNVSANYGWETKLALEQILVGFQGTENNPTIAKGAEILAKSRSAINNPKNLIPMSGVENMVKYTNVFCGMVDNCGEDVKSGSDEETYRTWGASLKTGAQKGFFARQSMMALDSLIRSPSYENLSGDRKVEIQEQYRNSWLYSLKYDKDLTLEDRRYFKILKNQ